MKTSSLTGQEGISAKNLRALSSFRSVFTDLFTGPSFSSPYGFPECWQVESFPGCGIPPTTSQYPAWWRKNKIPLSCSYMEGWDPPNQTAEQWQEFWYANVGLLLRFSSLFYCREFFFLCEVLPEGKGDTGCILKGVSFLTQVRTTWSPHKWKHNGHE